MSNIGQFNNKTTPWGRSNTTANIPSQSALQPQLLNQQGALGNIGASAGIVQFQQVFQNTMGLQQTNVGLGLQQIANNTMNAVTLNSQITSNPIFQQVGAASYPNTRGLNSTAFQTQNITAVSSVRNNSGSGLKQRVFTGTVTKVHDNFGFIDEDVFFQTNVCVKGSNPLIGDRVLVEATFNPSMPFKWNATRIQVLPMPSQTPSRQSNCKSYSSSYNTVPPQPDCSDGNHFNRSNRPKASLVGRGRERSREREKEDEIERKRRREERIKEQEKEERKSPLRRRSRSPKSRKRSRIVPRYMVQVPKIVLDLSGGDVLEIRRRYKNLYIPSDFFFTQIRWVDSFPPDKPFALNKPCTFHIMNKDIDPVTENIAVLEPSDGDYIFSAKVMLMSVPGMEELYHKCCAIAEDKERRDRASEGRDLVHPSRLINFLVGLRGKNETMAIGGPWSASLDGKNPEQDPSILIKTAIRTCKALTGIDLSHCTQWYRFVELYYRRSETTHKGKSVPARVETVVLFLPDVWSCLPTRLEWDSLQQTYRKQLERILKVQESNDDTSTSDEKEEELSANKLQPTHYSQLEPKTMVVSALRNELKARNISWKGLKCQLAARLGRALKCEAEKHDEVNKESKGDSESINIQDEKSTELEEKKLDDREKALLEKRYTLPDQQHILVYPSKTAKSGKFECTTMSLSLLLDYRPEDTKEHSFELSLFAELFNEMLMRDFGFNIFKVLFELPEKCKEKDEKKKKDDEVKKDDMRTYEIPKEIDRKKDGDRKIDDGEKIDDRKRYDDKKKDYEKRLENDTRGNIVKSLAKNKKFEENDCTKWYKDDDNTNESKKDEKKSDESDYGDDGEDEEKDRKKDKDKRKRERIKLYTKDKTLLLSFVYFDQTHCGYIFDKDIEDLLYTLGLNLSRAQVRKLVNKVVTRDSLHYRKLTDKPKNDLILNDYSEKRTNIHELALGNKRYLPVFTNNEVINKKIENADCEKTINKRIQNGFAIFNGSLVDVSSLMCQLERSEKARLETETKMVDLKCENQRLLEKYVKSNSTIKHLNMEVRNVKEKLIRSEESLSRVSAYSKLFQTTLLEVRDKIDPVLQSIWHREEPLKKDRDDKEKKHEENKSRWEKEAKIYESTQMEVVTNEKE